MMNFCILGTPRTAGSVAFVLALLGCVSPAETAAQERDSVTVPDVEAGTLEPAATRVLDRYIEKIGGEGAVREVNTRRLRGLIVVNFPNGVERKGTITIEQSLDKIRQHTVFPGVSDEVRVYDGEASWRIADGRDPEKVEGEDAARLRRAADFYYWYGVGYRERYVSLRSLGVQPVQGKSYEYLIGKRTDGHVDTLLFDPTTGMLECVAAVPKDGNVDTETEYNWILDYSEVDGVMVPAKFRRLAPRYNLSIEYRTIDFNVDLSGSFDRPASITPE